MHIQVVTFQLQEMSDAEFRALCDELAPAFVDVPGLISKVWLADRASNTYGGVYTFRDAAACAAYVASELFGAVKGHPSFADVMSREFGVLEGPTVVTHGAAGARA